MNKLTILHALKASIRTDDLEFYNLVLDADPPLESSLLTTTIDPDPEAAVNKIFDKLFN